MENSRFKFRAWDKENKKIITDNWYIFNYLSNREQNNEPQDKTQIIMQFTGLFDKQGVEIYEGDILYGVNGSINGHPWKWGNYVVKYEKGNHNVPLDWGSHKNHDSTHWFEVIGNIYENSNLLGDNIEQN